MNRDLFQRIDYLPKSLQQEVMDFIEFLLSKNKKKRNSVSGKHKSEFSPLNYNKYKFKEKDLKFNREEINER